MKQLSLLRRAVLTMVMLLIGSSTMVHADSNDPIYFWSDGICYFTFMYASGNRAWIAPDSCHQQLSGTVTIPETVTATITINGEPTERTCNVYCIQNRAFMNCTNITEINLPNTLSVISNEAFAGCSGLTSVTIPEGVTSLGDNAFTGCPITSLTWNAIDCGRGGGWDPSLVTEVNIGDKVQRIPMEFLNGGIISSIEFPLSLKEIGAWSFKNCKNLTEITIPDSITNIGYDAFSGCTNLTTLYWNAIHCASRGGLYVSNITQAFIGDQVEIIPPSFLRDAKITTITIPNSIKAISDEAFEYCTRLKTINLPSGLESIGNEAFQCCDSLASIDIPNTVTSIGNSAFDTMRSLTSIVLPSSLETIGDDAFNYCTKLTSITIPRTVTSIGERVLSYTPLMESIRVESGNRYYNSANGCNALIETATGRLMAGCKNTVIPNTVKRIAKWAFYHSRLARAYIPEGVKVIEDYAFRECWYLTHVTLPSTLDSIGNGAFYYTTMIDTVVCHAVNPPILDDQYAFDLMDYNKYAILYVPAQSVEDYRNTDYWSKFRYILPIGVDILHGDVNQDGVINISDVTALIDLIIENGSSFFSPYCDMNKDHSVGISDVVLIIDYILGH